MLAGVCRFACCQVSCGEYGASGMKSAAISLHDAFPETPVSGWVGARWVAWVPQTSASGQPKRPRQVPHPFLSQRRVWCLLHVHFDGVDLRFSMPQELDHVIEVLSQNPLPSGRSLTQQCVIGRPNRHWLSRLPAKAKSWKFRQRLCAYLTTLPEAQALRDFYAQTPIRFEFPQVYETFMAAQKAAHNP